MKIYVSCGSHSPRRRVCVCVDIVYCVSLLAKLDYFSIANERNL
jgi:hypothetical protein